ncbi:MAG TPA: MarR family transcriptional regulator, partial [Vicinamibacterales bacterium]
MGANTSAGEPDASGSDEGDTQTALDAIRRIVQALRESSRWAEQHLGVSGAQLFVLQALAAAPNMSVNELAARVHTHQSSVSTVVARLVARGLVRRERSALDGRRVELSLSPRGQRL